MTEPGSPSPDVLDLIAASGYQRLITLSVDVRRFAVLMFLLSGRCDLSLHWIRLKQQQLFRWRPGLAQIITKEILLEWTSDLKHDAELVRWVSDPACFARTQAHVFLTESLLAEHVRQLSVQGLLVPSHYMVQKFEGMLSHLPQTEAVTAQCRRLEQNKNSAKKWMQRFRRNWAIHWGPCAVPHGVGRDVQRLRAGIFFRWLRFALQDWKGLPVVTVNMDETMLNNVQDRKMGNSCSKLVSGDGAGIVLRKESPLPRTSLLASVCSDANLQKVLPQVRVVKSNRGECPSKPVLVAYADAGSPQIAHHGGTGWASSDALIWWLRRTRASIAKTHPDRRICLVIDCAPSHTSEKFLQAAQSMGIRTVFVPAKLTWLLQPLDVRIFSTFKSDIRAQEFRARAKAANGRLKPMDRIRLQGQSIKRTFVDASWEDTMRRCGLTGEMDFLSPKLQHLLADQNLTPAFPTAPEIVEVLQIPEARVQTIRALLYPRPVPALPAAPAASLSASAAASSSGPATSPTTSGVIRPLVLTAAARLYSASRARSTGANVWHPTVTPHRALTRSMTRSMSASGSQLAEPAPLGQAKRSRQQ